MKETVLQYFIVLMLHSAGCPNCPAQPYPVYIQMPSAEICQQVKALNADQPIVMSPLRSYQLECWAKPKDK